jgi:Ca-activated chloride channel family protein
MNGQELCGTIMDAAEARAIYDEIVRARRDPGLLEYAGCGLFRSSAFPLGPGQTAAITIRYSMTCPMDGERVEFWYPLNTGSCNREPIQQFNIRCDIESAAAIATVYSPTAELDVDRRSAKHVIASFDCRDYRPPADFQLFYESSRQEIGASLFTYWPTADEDGYYMLLLNPAPSDLEQKSLPKDIVLVLDRSGSMAGEKIVQARTAVRYVIERLNPFDRFNIVSYNDHSEACFEQLSSRSSRALEQAHDYVERIGAAGGTNIYDALDNAMDMCATSESDPARPAYIIFLTDGLPTVGTTGEEAILDNTRHVNRANVRLFCFGVGYDVNVRLLDRLAEQNHGRSAYVRPNESIESKVSSLYNRVRNPVLTDCKIELAGFRTRDNCPVEIGDLFQGDQLIRAGRIYHSNTLVPAVFGCGTQSSTLTLTGEVRGVRKTLTFSVASPRAGASSHKFVEKVWAVRRVGYLLDEIQLHGRVEEMVDELVRLSKKYGIVTPYTSYLADERKNLADVQMMREESALEFRTQSKSVSGPRAQMDAGARKSASDVTIPLPSSHSCFVAPLGSADVTAYESNQIATLETIRRAGNATLYKRGALWVADNASHLELTRDAAMITHISKFSDDYFALTAQNNDDENELLAVLNATEKLLVVLRGKAYLIE